MLCQFNTFNLSRYLVNSILRDIENVNISFFSFVRFVIKIFIRKYFFNCVTYFKEVSAKVDKNKWSQEFPVMYHLRGVGKYLKNTPLEGLLP